MGRWEEDHASPTPPSHLSTLLLCCFSQFHSNTDRETPGMGSGIRDHIPQGLQKLCMWGGNIPRQLWKSTHMKYLQNQGMVWTGRDPKLLSLQPMDRTIPIIPGFSCPKALMKYLSDQNPHFLKDNIMGNLGKSR